MFVTKKHCLGKDRISRICFYSFKHYVFDLFEGVLASVIFFKTDKENFPEIIKIIKIIKKKMKIVTDYSDNSNYVDYTSMRNIYCSLT